MPAIVSMKNQPICERKPDWRVICLRAFVSWCLLAILVVKLTQLAPAQAEPPASDSQSEMAIELKPLSGADGVFESVTLGDHEVQRGVKDEQGNYPLYIYLQLTSAAPQPGKPVYVEVTYLDLGTGRMSLQYNGRDDQHNYQQAEAGFARALTNSGALRTAVFRLDEAAFRHGQNLGADMRICSPSPKGALHLVKAELFSAPTALYTKLSARPWLEPYRGPTRNDINAKTLHKKVLCGYQGWFRCPGDSSEVGWRHWSRDRTRITPETLTFEMWPDMSEATNEEKYAVPGFTYPNGNQAHLYSSVNPRTVERHFDWMQQYGIDGVLVQRFVSSQDPADNARVLSYARAAANRTGRVFALEYDMTGAPVDKVFDLMVNDWKWTVDNLHITEDPRYLHHEGKPVLAIYGFFSDRFEPALAHRILDFFKNDKKYGVCLIGGCQWPWRAEQNPEWARAFRRFDVISPWNVGNLTKVGDQMHASTNQWSADLAEARRAKMDYMPVIYPGFSWDNLMRKPPGSTNVPRLGGNFFWQQFSVASQLGIDMVLVAMFDEVDEGTAIFKVTNEPPREAHFVTYENLPSDWYLRLTGEGSKLIRRQRKPTFTIPIKP